MQLDFGEGKISVSAGKRLNDRVLILEPNRGAGQLGAAVPTRQKDQLIAPDADGVILTFKNPESVQVVIDELENVKAMFADPLTRDDTLRLQGAHEVLGISM